MERTKKINGKDSSITKTIITGKQGIPGPQGEPGKDGLDGKNYSKAIDRQVIENKINISAEKDNSIKITKQIREDSLILNHNILEHVNNDNIHFVDKEEKDKLLSDVEALLKVPSFMTSVGFSGGGAGSTDSLWQLNTNTLSPLTAGNDITTTGNLTGNNLSGTNTGDQDLSGYLLNTTDTFTGILTVTGDVIINGDIDLSSSATNIELIDITTDALTIASGVDNYLSIRTGTSGSWQMAYGNTNHAQFIHLFEGNVQINDKISVDTINPYLGLGVTIASNLTVNQDLDVTGNATVDGKVLADNFESRSNADGGTGIVFYGSTTTYEVDVNVFSNTFSLLNFSLEFFDNIGGANSINLTYDGTTDTLDFDGGNLNTTGNIIWSSGSSLTTNSHISDTDIHFTKASINHDDLANITGTSGQYNHPTDANMIVLNNTSGTNTGDQDLSGFLLNTTDTLTGVLTIDGDLKVDQSIYIKEVASPQADISGYAQIWVDSADGRLIFTGDDGISREIVFKDDFVDCGDVS